MKRVFVKRGNVKLPHKKFFISQPAEIIIEGQEARIRLYPQDINPKDPAELINITPIEEKKEKLPYPVSNIHSKGEDIIIQ